jgi:hypothetical protein
METLGVNKKFNRFLTGNTILQNDVCELRSSQNSFEKIILFPPNATFRTKPAVLYSFKLMSLYLNAM